MPVPISGTAEELNNGMFQNQFTYDADGNILTQLRKDEAGATIDDLSYQYRRASNQQLLQNRLYHVNDNIAAGAYADDIDDMGSFTDDPLLINTDNNYAYDELGQLIKDEQETIAEIKWRNDGKIAQIKRGSGGTQKSLVFGYNPSGERISKKIFDQNGTWVETTYYIRDATNNVMATYLNTNGTSETFDLTERYIYGSSRVGVYKEPVSMLATPGNPAFHYVRPGYRQYELSNHLGNVTTTITAQKVPLYSGTTITGFAPQIVKSFDYSPFGVTRVDFDVTARLGGGFGVDDGVRYGFNGMEKDDEIKGVGNSLDFGARIYDSRLGRWLSIDPLAAKYPDTSPYAGMANSPISIIDIDGRENIIYLVVLPSKDSKLTKEDYKTIAANANKRLTDIGIKTEVRVFDPEINGEFDASYIDDTDSFALIGSVDAIKSTVTNENGDSRPGFEGADFASKGWSGGSNNPEESDLGFFNNSYRSDRLGQGILIDAEGMPGFSAKLGISLEDGMTLTILHGATHNARGGGHRGEGLNLSADGVRDLIGAQGLDAVYDPKKNVKNAAGFRKNFGESEPQDNYDANKKAVKEIKD